MSGGGEIGDFVAGDEQQWVESCTRTAYAVARRVRCTRRYGLGWQPRARLVRYPRFVLHSLPAAPTCRKLAVASYSGLQTRPSRRCTAGFQNSHHIRPSGLTNWPPNSPCPHPFWRTRPESNSKSPWRARRSLDEVVKPSRNALTNSVTAGVTRNPATENRRKHRCHDAHFGVPLPLPQLRPGCFGRSTCWGELRRKLARFESCFLQTGRRHE